MTVHFYLPGLIAEASKNPAKSLEKERKLLVRGEVWVSLSFTMHAENVTWLTNIMSLKYFCSVAKSLLIGLNVLQDCLKIPREPIKRLARLRDDM